MRIGGHSFDRKMVSVTATGFLVDGRFYPGGEGTGWELQTGGGGNIEVDVQRVISDAMRLRNSRVTVTGYYTDPGYISRNAQVLMAESMRAAQA